MALRKLLKELGEGKPVAEDVAAAIGRVTPPDPANPKMEDADNWLDTSSSFVLVQEALESEQITQEQYDEVTAHLLG